jgi:hypothetical protein
MREPCPRCGCGDGTVAMVNGQDTVRCAECERFCYNAPRTETGRPRRSLRTRPQVSPGQRARILLRDNLEAIGVMSKSLAVNVRRRLSHNARISLAGL